MISEINQKNRKTFSFSSSSFGKIVQTHIKNKSPLYPTSGEVSGMEKNTPQKKFRAGTVSATIWKNKSQEGNEFSSVSFEKGYKDKAGEWKSTNQLGVSDLPKAMVVLGKAYEFLALKESAKEAS